MQNISFLSKASMIILFFCYFCKYSNGIIVGKLITSNLNFIQGNNHEIKQGKNGGWQ